jgi:hypothetical protein
VIRELIKADGTRRDLIGPHAIEDLRKMIGADSIDTVMLHNLGHPMHVMLVDDLGHDKQLPVNVEATKLYHANCRPGTRHQIRGDVVVVPDDDFAALPARRLPVDDNSPWPFPQAAHAASPEQPLAYGVGRPS